MEAVQALPAVRSGLIRPEPLKFRGLDPALLQQRADLPALIQGDALPPGGADLVADLVGLPDIGGGLGIAALAGLEKGQIAQRNGAAAVLVGGLIGLQGIAEELPGDGRLFWKEATP